MSESKYESKITSAACSAAQVYRVLSNMENLNRVKDMIPKDKIQEMESGWFGAEDHHRHRRSH